MFGIVWRPPAPQQFIAIWAGASPAERTALEADVMALDRRLGHHPHEEGESREMDDRILFEGSLQVRFSVDDEAGEVVILGVRLRWARRP